jgi:hypothetical protein
VLKIKWRWSCGRLVYLNNPYIDKFCIFISGTKWRLYLIGSKSNVNQSCWFTFNLWHSNNHSLKQSHALELNQRKILKVFHPTKKLEAIQQSMMLWNRKLHFYILEDVWNACMYRPQAYSNWNLLQIIGNFGIFLENIHSCYNLMHKNTFKH